MFICLIHFDSLSYNAFRKPPVAYCRADGIRSLSYHASCSSYPVSQRSSSLNNCATKAFHLSDQNYILKGLNASFSLENPLHRDEHGLVHTNKVWFGRCNVSGFDMTISLAEIQVQKLVLTFVTFT